MAWRDRLQQIRTRAQRVAPFVVQGLRELPSLLASLRDVPRIVRTLKPNFEGRLALLVTSASLVPCLVLWLLCAWSLLQSYVAGYESKLQSLSAQSAGHLQVWLKEQEEAVGGLGQSANLIAAVRSRSAAAAQTLLNSAKATHPRFAAVRLVRPNGKVWQVNTGAELPAAPMGAWLARAATHGSPAWGLSPSTGDGQIWAYGRIGEESQKLGVVCCLLRLEALQTELEQNTSKQLNTDTLLVERGAGRPAGDSESDVAASLMPRLTQAGTDMSGSGGRDGSTVLSAWHPVSPTSLTVVVQMPRSQLLVTLLTSLWFSLLAALCLGLFCSAMGLLLARRLLDPLARLTRAAQAIADGQRNVRVAMLRSDEIGELANTFDRMAGRLEVTLTELETARDSALSGFRSKSRFLANMTHELRTPLNSIIGYSEMLMGEAEDAGQAQTVEDLGVIRDAGRDLLGLINSILDLSKLEAGKLALDLETFALTDLFREIATVFTPLLREQNNTLAQEPLLDKRDQVRMDRQKLKQMLLNLVSNANKFTRNGHITLRARLSGEAFDQLVLEVEDSGIGMTVEQCTHIFDEFSQADESTTRRFGGTGLGLTIVQRFAELMGGKVSVYSELEKGSLFRITLPRPAIDPGPRAAE